MTGVPERQDVTKGPVQGEAWLQAETSRVDMDKDAATIEPLLEELRVPTDVEIESDFLHVGHVYRAVVTAHFPDLASQELAVARIEELGLGPDSHMQLFAKEEPEAKGDENDPGLAPGEGAMILQLSEEDEAHRDEIIRLCEEAGAKHARFTPRQSIGGEVE